MLFVDARMIGGGGLMDGTLDGGRHRLIQATDIYFLRLRFESNIVTVSLVVDCRNAVRF